MLTIEETRKSLWNDFSNLSDKEIEQIRDNMFNFWSLILEN